MNPQASQSDPAWAQTLKTGRIVLAGLISGEVIMLGVAATIIANQPSASPSPAARALVIVGAVMAAAAISLIPFLKPVLLRNGRDENGEVQPQQWLSVTLVCGALHESYGLIGGVACIVGRSLSPGAALVGISVVMLFIMLLTARVPGRSENATDRLRESERI